MEYKSNWSPCCDRLINSLLKNVVKKWSFLRSFVRASCCRCCCCCCGKKSHRKKVFATKPPSNRHRIESSLNKSEFHFHFSSMSNTRETKTPTQSAMTSIPTRDLLAIVSKSSTSVNSLLRIVNMRSCFAARFRRSDDVPRPDTEVYHQTLTVFLPLSSILMYVLLS